MHRRFFYLMGLLCLVVLAWLWLRIREDVAKSNATGPSGNAPKTASQSPSSTTAPKTGIGGQPRMDATGRELERHLQPVTDTRLTD